MKISEYIEILQGIQREHGDLPVYKYVAGSSVGGAVQMAFVPKVRELREKTPRTQYEKLHYSFDEKSKASGRKILMSS